MTNATAKAQPSVPIRHMDFGFDVRKASKYLWGDNSWGSAFNLTFSAFIPAGERFVIDSVRQFRDQVDDPELRDRATGLIGQEAMHSKLHSAFNRMYDAKGLPVSEMARMADAVYLDFFMKRLPAKTQLAIACAIEHATAILAEEVFTNGEQMMEKLDPVARDFLIWHLLEELEHKSVAFDMYQEIDGRYVHRVLVFLLAWAINVPMGLYSIRQMLKTPGFDQGKKKNREAINQHWRLFFSIAPAFFSYLDPNFHPDNKDTTELLTKWRDKLFGKTGSIRRFVTKVIDPGRKAGKNPRIPPGVRNGEEVVTS